MDIVCLIRTVIVSVCKSASCDVGAEIESTPSTNNTVMVRSTTAERRVDRRCAAKSWADWSSDRSHFTVRV